MDAQLIELARAAGASVVTLMATDAWERTRDGLVSLFSRSGSASRAEGVQGELDAARDDLLTARETGDDLTERELRDAWSGRMRRLLVERPDLAEDLREMLAELDPGAKGAPHSVHLRAEASGSGRVYQAGRDQHITER
ncbi:hypothetical protein AB0M42_09620 [Streptomyces sp. NPDC051784]|uniref:hypothetical protein n=1 Tax=Streptomyces sp. NPDC051784 TaxID=3155805 RepID=UPI003445E497